MMEKIKNAMIFGATGQDSSYLSELLLEKDYKIVGVKRRTSTNNTWRLDSVIHNENFSLVEGDIVDPSSVNQIISEHQPDEIYNLAAQSHVHTSFNQPLYTFQVNALGVIHILEAVRNYSPTSKVYQASTSELWGSNYDIDPSLTDVNDHIRYQDENTRFSPNSPYAVAKLAAHESIRLYRDAYDIWACAGLLMNHESPRRGEEFVTRKITQYIGRLAYSGFDPNFLHLKLGNIDAVRDWSHAQDMVRGMWMMLQQDKPKDYVLCNGTGYSVKQFLDTAFKHVGIHDWSRYVDIDPSLYRPCEVEFLQGRYNLAKKELGWEPEISFDDLVREMVDIDIYNVKYN